ncbi:enolase C-terminal domain-like protein [Micromonospora zamorensis]|uniref:enolase C-terminal domain-like protein n=1 Tax=Micromonospora zamorensis TaxID=709883 RepID=UPI003680ABD3
MNTVVQEIRAHQLAGQDTRRLRELAEPLSSVMVEPKGTGWPEHQRRYALELVANGVSGWFGPVSEVVLTLIRDNHAAGLIGHDVLEHRNFPRRSIVGRHCSGAHARQAQSVLELACWDLASRATGTPVGALLGGAARTAVPVYASALGLDVLHPGTPEAAEWIDSAGFWGQKWALPATLIDLGPMAVDTCLSRIRAAVPDARIMVDGLGQCRLDQALAVLPVLVALRLTWAEELVEAGSAAWLSLRSRAAGGVPMAAGEHAYDPGEQSRLLTDGLVDIWQPDVAWCGGISRALHTAQVAADLGVATFPHGGSLAAAVALAGVCTARAVPAVEYHLTIEPLRQCVVVDALRPINGELLVRSIPGLAEYAMPAGALPISLGAVQ